MEILAASVRGRQDFPDGKAPIFYCQILGISAPWKIVNVELDMEAKRVVITAATW
jgi:hypothetical protein